MATTHLPGISAAPKMSDEMFRSIRTFIYQNTGIYFQDNKKYLLEGRLGKRLQVLEIDEFETYFQRVRFGADKIAEMKFLYEAVTINETFFFRMSRNSRRLNTPSSLNSLPQKALPGRNLKCGARQVRRGKRHTRLQ